MLLEDNLNDILMNFDMNFTSEPKNILKKAATDERMIHHNNLFFKTGDPIIKNFDFLKKIWYIAWFIDLLNEKISTDKAVKEEDEMIKK